MVMLQTSLRYASTATAPVMIPRLFLLCCLGSVMKQLANYATAVLLLQVAWNQVELAGSDLDEEARERLFAGKILCSNGVLALCCRLGTYQQHAARLSLPFQYH
eukprot:GHUV01036993.1.p1 GENE.GHUV01036993.1~~GHUV01036993.1.p1  ORF type:complete len:104 (-),score=24.53 GHUV01036993.1:727-1038(-)